MRVTIRDIAERLNLSHATVSRVLNKKADSFISEATRERVLNAAREMGYRPNLAARTLATGQTRTIALWMHKPYTPYYSRVAQCVSQHAERKHYQIMILNPQQVTDVALPKWPVDGILACDLPKAEQAYRESGMFPSIPLVGMGMNYQEDCDYVGIDLYIGAKEAFQHLVDAGCRRIAYLVDEETLEYNDPRHRAYQDILQETGLTSNYIFSPDQTRASARATMRRYLQESPRPEGLFCHNDDMAIGAYRALCDLNLKTPNDLLLIGCDGIEDTEYLETPISAIIAPVESMISQAWSVLENRMKDCSAPLHKTLLPTAFVARASSLRRHEPVR